MWLYGFVFFFIRGRCVGELVFGWRDGKLVLVGWDFEIGD